MKSFYALLFFALISFNSIAQSLNDYKYVIVPDRYSWAGAADKHQVNSLTTFLFKKYGFDAYQLGTILPPDMNKGSCNTLTADVEESSSFVRTKLKVVLKDCKGAIVFATQEGESKEKDFKKAYHEALRDAFLSIKELEYSYAGGAKGNLESVKKMTLSNGVSIESDQTTPVQKEELPEVVAKESAQKYEITRYLSLDGAYVLEVKGGVVTFYEEGKEIGKSLKETDNFYQVSTTEFAGKGYFENNQFVIEREIKGVQGLVKMIFEKE